MNELHLPWLELAILIPLLGAIKVMCLRDPQAARRWSVFFSGLASVCALAGALNFYLLGVAEATDLWNLPHQLIGLNLFVLDELSAPLLPLSSLLFLLTAVATQGAKVRRFSFAWTLVSQAIVLAALSSKEPWLIVALLSIEAVPPYLELRARNRTTRVFMFHMALFAGLMVAGQTMLESKDSESADIPWAAILLLGAVFIRSGMAPLHCWMTDLFEHATFGTALLFVTPLMGAYAAVRLVVPIAPEGILHGIGLVSLFTSVYAAGMALVQKEARRFFCYIFLSHSALVLVGLETVTPIGLTGALCVWLSVGPALSGFGLTLRALEARHRRLSLTSFHGLYDHTPALAVCFVLTGMASIGFPGTFGFLGNELLVNGAVETFPMTGIAVVFAAALNGIAVVKAYFLLFTGTRHVSTVPLRIGKRERFAVLTLAALILGGGLFPQPGVTSRYDAANYIIEKRNHKSLQAR
ncbi:MAG: oxidoreductase [Planctomycetes bacterium]|nr:oxidoreductase [Planctomycetota bacterium]